MTNFVQLYKSTDLNAPVLTGQVGSLITLLNKCLVDGYTAASVTSIVESGLNYTVTLAVANTTLVVGNYITIAGGSPAGINIAMRINTVTDSTHVICTGPGSLGAITGTLTYAKSGLGWAKAFAAGTNAQTYRSPDTGSNRFYLQVVDNGATAGGAKEAQVYGAEVMSADQAVTSGQFPTTVQLASGLCARKSTTADATARAWTLIGDDKTFYLIMVSGDTVANHGWPAIGFGHFLSFKPGDGYNTFIAGNLIFNATTAASVLNGIGNCSAVGAAASCGLYVARSYTQTGSSVLSVQTGYSNTSGKAAVGALAVSGALLSYPNPSDSGLYVAQLFLADAASALRGRMPGWYQPLHGVPLSNYDLVTGVTGLSGVTLTALSISGFDNNNSNVLGLVLVDTFGPWA